MVSAQSIQLGRSLFFILLGLALAGLFFLLWPRAPWHQASLEETLSWQRVRDIQAWAEIAPEAQRLEGRAIVRLEWQGPSSGLLYFQLNPGFAVGDARIGDTELNFQREGAALWVQLEDAPPEFDLTLEYGGTFAPETPHPASSAPNEALLPALSWWYPTVPNASYTFRGEVSVPEDFEVIGAGVLDNHRIDVDERHVAWREARPVFGASIAAGRYAKSTRWLDDVWLNVYWPEGDTFDPGSLLDAAEQGHEFLEEVLGDDGFRTINLVLSPRIAFPFHGGNSVLFLPFPLPSEMPLEMIVAKGLAGNWWGGTVAARWTTTRAEAGAWLMEGLREVFAYRSYQALRSKDAVTRFLEQQQPLAANDLRLKDLTVETFWELDLDERQAFSRLSGAVARLLEQRLGEAPFDAACRRLLQIHRFASVSSAALQHELELAGDASLDPFFAQWFDTVAAFDYAIANASATPGEVRVNLQNRGEINLNIPLEIAVVSGNAVDVHDLSAPGFAAEIPLPLRGELRSLLLDPYAVTPDEDRSNNLFPQRFFPEAMDITDNGVNIRLGDNPWQPGAWRSLHLSHQLEAPAAAISTAETPTARSSQESREVYGGWVWKDNRLLDPDGREISSPLTTIPLPLAHTIALNDTGLPAWLDAQGRLWGVRQDSDQFIADVWLDEVSAFAWSDASPPYIAAIEKQGSIIRFDVDTADLKVILERERPVVEARLTDDGSHVAWLEANGLLRLAELATPIPLYATVRGDILDFGWTLDGARLLVLTRETQAALPSPLTAVYRISALEPNGIRGHEKDLGPLLVDAAAPELATQHPAGGALPE